ncbi:LOW QUALITY PROTEIN: pentraxin-4-like [Tiliqua scincoides]|uniref:LOW QUALITY PROTEIN: pentraxin-4-like n=1 Tax=Tiliqua scincoides TaxID=71010 RepID=UPI0034636849
MASVPILLILGTVCLQGTLLQQPPGTGEQRKPFFERFRRLEEQFRRFQEVTLILMRLQEIAGNYNISYNIDARFEHLLSQHSTLESSTNETHAAFHGELSHLKTWMKKLQNRTKKLDLKVGALEESLHRGERESASEKQEQQVALVNLSQEVAQQKEDTRALLAGQGTLQQALESLRDALKSQGTKLDEMEQQLKSPMRNEVLLPSPLVAAHLLNQASQEKEPEAAGGQSPTLKKLRAKHRQRKKLQQETSHFLAQSKGRGLQSSSPPGQTVPLQDTEPGPAPSLLEPQALRQEQPVTDKASEEKELPQSAS